MSCTSHPAFESLRRACRSPRSPWVLGLLLSLLALIQAAHRAGQGHCALLKWDWAFVEFFAGGPLYGVGAEGYPTLPLSLLVMSPFHFAGSLAGALLWAVFKLGLACWIVTRALQLVRSPGPALKPAAVLFVLLFSLRPMLSDITHGNLNLLVGASVASAAWSWSRGREFSAGLWLGLGSVLKITPALGVLWLVRKGSARGLGGMATGLAIGLALPALVVGPAQTLEYTLHFWDQMIRPYLEGRPLSLMQTEHINQSLYGVLARYTTDSVAIPAATAGSGVDLSIHVVALSQATFQRLHQALSLALLGFFLVCSARRRPASRECGVRVLGEFSMLALTMLLLSERSWKHHYVLLAFPIAFLVAHAQGRAAVSDRRLARVALVVAALLFGCTGSAFLGHHGSNLAEAFGAYCFGALTLLMATGWLTRHSDGPLQAEPQDP